MRGKALDEALIIECRLFGDRAYAVIEQANGKVGNIRKGDAVRVEAD
jgi:hypothetical protein